MKDRYNLSSLFLEIFENNIQLKLEERSTYNISLTYPIFPNNFGFILFPILGDYLVRFPCHSFLNHVRKERDEVGHRYKNFNITKNFFNFFVYLYFLTRTLRESF